VYDLRHSFAMGMYRQTGDPKSDGGIADAQPEQYQVMDRYTLGGVA